MPGRFRHVSLMVTLGLLSAFTIAGRAEELLRVPLDISSDRLRSREVEGARQWTLDGGHVLRQTGMPELPTLRFEVLIPRDRSVRRLWIEGGTLRSLGKGQSLPTVDALLLPEAETPVREVIYDGAQLDDSPLYPPAEARLSADAFEHGYHVVAVEVAPLRMDRTSGELWWRESPVLMLELEPQRPAVPIVDRLRHDEHWEERILTQLRSRLANPEKLLGYERPAPRMATGKDTPRADKTPSLSDRPVQHLILTTSELASEFQRLADHRIRTGMSSLVVTIDDVLANYRQGVDLAETLRLYIIDAYSKWGVDYVLLGGDSELLPARYVRSTFYPVGSSTDIPADLYYAALDGNWNADGDHIFGEHFASGSDQGDFVDFAAELAVGRAPVSNLGEAALFIDKILDYELPADSNHQTQAIFASEVLFPADWDGLEIIQLDGASFSEILIDSMLVCDPDMSWSPLRLYENFTPYPGAQPLTKAAVLSGLDSGQYGLYHHIGHGFYFNMSVGDATIGPSDADALSNAPNYFVLYSLNCSSSAFDFECLNERFLLSPGGGSVVSIGSSRAAFPNAANGYQKEFYRLWICEEIRRVGDAILGSRLPFQSNTFFNTSDRWTHFVYTLLGDPAMRLWRSAPREVEVILPTVVNVGQNEINVVVVDVATNSGLSGVTVALRKGDEDYQVLSTNELGLATASFAAETAGTIELWVSGKDVIPQQHEIVVNAGAQPYVSIAGFTLEDGGGGNGIGNGNGRPEAGEQIEIRPLFRNGGAGPIAPSNAILRLDDTYVTMVDSTVSVPALSAGEVAESAEAFIFEIDPTVPDAHQIDLRVVIEPGGGIEWVDHEPLSLASGELELVRLEIDDTAFGNGNGQVDPGEEVELVFSLKNFGAGAIGPVSGTLSALDPGATVVDAVGSWGAMSDPLSTVSNHQDRFRVTETDVGVNYVYALTLTDDVGRVQVFNVDLRAPAAIGTLAPDFGGAVGEIVLRWEPSNASDLRGYRVYRRVLGAPEFSQASADILEGSATFRDRGLPALSRFEYGVTVVDLGGLESALSNVVSVSTAPPELDCFPLPLERETSGSLAVGHLDGDGVLDMVVPSRWVYAIDGECNEKVDGDNDSQTFGPISALGGRYGPAGIALGNLDGKPGLDIVASSWDTKELYVFDAHGDLLPGWPRALIDKTWTTPVLGDLDGDGDLEIVISDTSGYTYAFHHDGVQVADGDSDPATDGVIVPRRSTTITTGTLNEAFGRTTPALFDVDQDGSQEILFGSKFQNAEAQEFFYAWNADGSASQAPGWPKTFAPRSEFLASPTIADLDGDSIVEIIQLCENDSLYVWHPDGSRVAPFPVQYTSQAVNRDSLAPSVAIGDFTQNGMLELVVVETIGGTQSRIRIVDHENITLNGWPVTVGNLSESSPVVGDLDGDGFLDVLWGVGGGADNLPNYLYAWNRQGDLLAGFPILMNGFVRSTPTICDFDGDGNVNVVLASWDRQMHVWDLLAPFDPALVPWPTFAGNVYRNGVLDTHVATSAPASQFLPRHAYLAPNRPNPFNPSTVLRFVLPAASQDLRLAIVDVRGRWIRTLHRGPLEPGEHEKLWDGKDDQGRNVVSGIYYALLEIDGWTTQTRKLVLVK